MKNNRIVIIGFLLFVPFVKGEQSSHSIQSITQFVSQANSPESPKSMLTEGKAYRDGQLVARNYTTAAQWYRKAAEAGNADAELLLGLCYASGIGVAKSTKDAVSWLQHSSDHGNHDAQFFLGILFDAAGMEDESLEQWLKAAHGGNVAAQTISGLVLLESQSWEKQRDGVAWLTKAAEQNDSTAQWRLGKFRDESVGVSRNRNEAIKWYRKSAEQGNRDARKRLLEMSVSNVPSGDCVTCTNLGFSARIPIPKEYEPADSVKQASLELESIVLGDSTLLPVLYNSKEIENPLPFTNPSSIRILYSPRRKESICPDDETWARVRKEFFEASSVTSRKVPLSSSASARSDDAEMEPLCGPGWGGRFSVVGFQTDNPLDALKGGLMFAGVARIRDRIVAVTFSSPIDSLVDPQQRFRNTVEQFLSRLYELNKQQ